MTPLEKIGQYGEVPIDVEVELGRQTMTVHQILELESGSIIRMNRSAGENFDVFAGSALIAFGEIVLVEDQFAVRLTDFNEED